MVSKPVTVWRPRHKSELNASEEGLEPLYVQTVWPQRRERALGPGRIGSASWIVAGRGRLRTRFPSTNRTTGVGLDV